jgi:hypothetical protein
VKAGAHLAARAAMKGVSRGGQRGAFVVAHAGVVDDVGVVVVVVIVGVDGVVGGFNDVRDIIDEDANESSDDVGGKDAELSCSSSSYEDIDGYSCACPLFLLAAPSCAARRLPRAIAALARLSARLAALGGGGGGVAAGCGRSGSQQQHGRIWMHV